MTFNKSLNLPANTSILSPPNLPTFYKEMVQQIQLFEKGGMQKSPEKKILKLFI